MVRFELATCGFDVWVDNKLFGRLMGNVGFFTSPTAIREYIEVSSDDLTQIALKADEVKIHGSIPPICPSCKGTPNFPNEIYNPNEGMQTCQAETHPFNICHFGKL